MFRAYLPLSSLVPTFDLGAFGKGVGSGLRSSGIASL